MSQDFVSIHRVLEKSSRFLADRGVPSPKCDAEWIVSSVLNRSRMELFLNYEEILKEEKLDQIRKLVVSRGCLNSLPMLMLMAESSTALIAYPEQGSLQNK